MIFKLIFIHINNIVIFYIYTKNMTEINTSNKVVK